MVGRPKQEIHLPAVLENLHALMRFINDYGVEAGLDERRRQQLEVAADEILTNVIRYA